MLFTVHSSPDQLVKPYSDGVELSDGVTEKVLVLCRSRVALNKALGQVVDEKTKRMVNRLEALNNGKKPPPLPFN